MFLGHTYYHVCGLIGYGEIRKSYPLSLSKRNHVEVALLVCIFFFFSLFLPCRFSFFLLHKQIAPLHLASHQRERVRKGKSEKHLDKTEIERESVGMRGSWEPELRVGDALPCDPSEIHCARLRLWQFWGIADVVAQGKREFGELELEL